MEDQPQPPPPPQPHEEVEQQTAPESTSEPATSNAHLTLTVLSYNVGLLQFKLLGFEVFANPPHALERLPCILKALQAQHDVDILCIQECYSKTHVKAIRKALKDILPHYAHHTSSGFSPLKFDNGLLILSKYPISDVVLDPYKKVSSLESWMANKSSLACSVAAPHFQKKIRVINLHTTAGGTAHPEDPDVDVDREDELKQCLALAKTAEEDGQLPMIVGDFNCGPEASASNYNFMIKNNYWDTFQAFKDAHPEADTGGVDVTWDPKNYLNEIGPHAHCPGQRCDHLMLPKHFENEVEITSGKIVFTEANVPIGKGKLSTLSDHYGLKVSMQKKL